LGAAGVGDLLIDHTVGYKTSASNGAAQYSGYEVNPNQILLYSRTINQIAYFFFQMIPSISFCSTEIISPIV